MERLYRTLERIRSSMAESACRDSAQSKIPHPACAPKDSETPAGNETLGAAAQNGAQENPIPRTGYHALSDTWENS